jgi:hypothetical protein
MLDEIPYHERIKNYTMDDLIDVITHIDRDNYPDRYSLVLQEIEKRAAALKAPPGPDAEEPVETPSDEA